jgi:hypothetical protein
MAKEKKTSSKGCPTDWQRKTIKELFEKVEKESCGFAAVGLDMAAQEDKWGLSLITLDKSCTKGNLHLILPHFTAIAGSAEHFVVSPSLSYLKALLSELRSRKITTALAVDIPLGWPAWHGKFTNSWSATSRTSQQLLSRDEFERRITDHKLKEKTKANLLAVGADKIASAAYAWAMHRVKLTELIDVCDVGVKVDGESLVTLFETYPAGYVRLNYGDFVKYKSGEKKTKKCPSPRSTASIRYALFDQLQKDYSLRLNGCESQINQACSVCASDAFDGFLSALTAWDYLRWRKYGVESHETTTPESLLERELTDEDIELINLEGWILIRKSALKKVDCEKDCRPAGDEFSRRYPSRVSSDQLPVSNEEQA